MATIGEKIYLQLAFSGIRLNEREVNYLKGGIEWVSALIVQAIPQDATVWITLTNLEIILTDYQEEGLYYASADWAAGHFNFPLPSYEVFFDKRRNRYDFPALSDINKNC